MVIPMPFDVISYALLKKRMKKLFEKQMFYEIGLHVSSTSPDKIQDVLYSYVDSLDFDPLIGILTAGGPIQYITSNTTTPNGVNIYKLLKIKSGVSYSLGVGPGIIVASTIENYGGIQSAWIKAPGGSKECDKSGDGGVGRGGIIILARKFRVGAISCNGGVGWDCDCECSARGVGKPGGNGEFWLVSGDSSGFGGKGGDSVSLWIAIDMYSYPSLHIRFPLWIHH